MFGCNLFGDKHFGNTFANQTITIVVGSGGVVLGGPAGITATVVHLPTDGAVLGGTASPYAEVTVPITPVGVVVGVSGSPVVHLEITMDGGIVIGGAGQIGPYYNPTPSTAEVLADFASGIPAATFTDFDAADDAEVWRTIRP
jgi:hypothetical protein